MELYIWIWAISLLLTFLPKCSKLLFCLVGVILVFIAGFRDIEVGSDTRSYLDIFETVGSGVYAGWVEPLWNLICYLSYNFVSSNYNIFLIIIAAIIIFNFFFVFYKDSPFPCLSIFILISLHIYTGSFNIMRQYFAMSFLLMAWHFYYHEQKTRSIIYLLIALFSHHSTVFSLIIYLWNKVSLSTKKILVLFFLSFIFGLMMNENILNLLTGGIFEKLVKMEKFLNMDTAFRENSGLVMMMVIAQNVLTMTVVMMTRKEMKANFWYKTFVLSNIIFNATCMIAYATRFYTIFAMSQLIFIPLFIKQLNAKRKFLAYFVLVIYMSAHFFRILIPNGNGILPYNSVLFR